MPALVTVCVSLKSIEFVVLNVAKRNWTLKGIKQRKLIELIARGLAAVECCAHGSERSISLVFSLASGATYALIEIREYFGLRSRRCPQAITFGVAVKVNDERRGAGQRPQLDQGMSNREWLCLCIAVNTRIA